MNKKSALIFGASGQDATYLSKFLLDKGYFVYGASRDTSKKNLENYIKLNIYNDISFYDVSIIDFRSVLQLISKIKPDEIYNLSGQTSVATSFLQPVETIESIILGTLNILEAIKYINLPIKFYNAGSSECYGNVKEPVTENTPFYPRSPYGFSKAAAFWEVLNYREAYGLFCCTGILFNHESPLRQDKFVTMKILNAAYEISNGSTTKLQLGNINISRDWGWAPEYVEAMWLILQHNTPDDFIIATGNSYTLKEYINEVFMSFNLDWEKHVEVNNHFFRPTDIESGIANPNKAYNILNWRAKSDMKSLVKKLVHCKVNNTYF
jgi:GDPmannose 4,6-dehydratase